MGRPSRTQGSARRGDSFLEENPGAEACRPSMRRAGGAGGERELRGSRRAGRRRRHGDPQVHLVASEWAREELCRHRQLPSLSSVPVLGSLGFLETAQGLGQVLAWVELPDLAATWPKEVGACWWGRVVFAGRRAHVWSQKAAGTAQSLESPGLELWAWDEERPAALSFKVSPGMG